MTTAADAGLGPAAPGHRPPPGEQPRLDVAAPAARPGGRPCPRRQRRAAARAHRWRQDRGRRLPAADRDGTAAVGRPVRHLRLPAQGAAEQPAAPGWRATPHGSAAGLRSGTATPRAPVGGRSSPRRPTCCSPRRNRWSRCSSARTSTTGGCSPTCGPSSSTRCTRSAATTAAGTCSPCWNGSRRIAGQPIQRIGLSATVGNPGELLHWLQGSARWHAARRRRRAGGRRPADDRRPGPFGRIQDRHHRLPAADADIQLDYVGAWKTPPR